MKRLIPFISFLLMSVFVYGQQLQTTPANENAVMIIPFDPNMYFSDSDEALAKYNQKTVKEVRTLFRYGLNVNLNARIMSEYETRPILSDSAHGAREDLYAIYKGITYFKDKSMPMINGESAKAKQPVKSGFNKLFGKNQNENEKDDNAQTTSKLKTDDVSRDYINVKIYNPDMLAFLKRKYGTELFVFVNQFNLVTNYEHCLDRATNTFEREVMIHFSIFDHTGKQLAGDVAVAKFASNTNDMMEIMRSNFPILSDYLAHNMPSNVKQAVKETSKEEQMEFEKIEYNYQDQ